MAHNVSLSRDHRLVAEAIGVFEHELLMELDMVGYTPQTIALVEFAPLARIAWADGCVSKRQRAAIFKLRSASMYISTRQPTSFSAGGWNVAQPMKSSMHRCPRFVRS